MRLTSFIQSSLLVSAVFLMAGCGDAKNYETAVKSWQGAPESALINTWGQPADVTQLKSGNHIDVFYNKVEKTTPTKIYTPSMGRVTPQAGGMMQSSTGAVQVPQPGFWCEAQFEVNPHGTIVDTSYSGNNCVSTVAKAKSWSY